MKTIRIKNANLAFVKSPYLDIASGDWGKGYVNSAASISYASTGQMHAKLKVEGKTKIYVPCSKNVSGYGAYKFIFIDENNNVVGSFSLGEEETNPNNTPNIFSSQDVPPTAKFLIASLDTSLMGDGYTFNQFLSPDSTTSETVSKAFKYTENKNLLTNATWWYYCE